MRTSLPLVLVAAFVLALAAGVRGEEPVSLDTRIDALQREVTWLRGREARVSAYVNANGERGEALEKLVSELRAGGFATHASPTAAREALLRGLAELAQSLRVDLPILTDAERAAQAAFAK